MAAAVWMTYLAVLALLAVYGAHRLSLVIRSWRIRAERPTEPPPLPERRPFVTVQLPLYNERCVAERVIDAAAALRWPADRLEIQILDDSTDETSALCAARVEAIAARGISAQHIRRPRREGFKAGALQHGLSRARGELVLVLDADFVPPPDLLERTAGYFADPACGMVQVRWEHLNRRASMLTRVQALLLDGHFVVEQAVRWRLGRFFNFNGTAGVWRREAIDGAGGWHADTLTEDLDLSYRALLAGWRFRYVLEEAAPAELPEEMNAFKTQQFRWAKGSVQVARKLLPEVMRSPLPRRVKVEAFFHLTQNVPYLLTFALALVAAPALLSRADGGGYAAELALAAGTLGTLGLYCATSQAALGREGGWLAGALRVPALVAITAGICASQARAVVEALVGRPSEFVRTPKRGAVTDGAAGGLAAQGYRARSTATSVVELGLAAHFAAAVAVAGATGQWLAAPILGVFALGFGYVGSRSLAAR